MTASLNYTSSLSDTSFTPASVHLRRLALGAGILALGMMFPILFWDLLWPLLYINTPVMDLVYYFTPYEPYGVAILLGVILLAWALPPRPAPPHQTAKFRGKKFAAIHLAAAQLVFITLIQWWAYLESYRTDPSRLEPYLVGGLYCLLRLAHLALVICGMAYLLAVGARLQRQTLGIIAACALLPSALLLLTRLTFSVGWDLHMQYTTDTPMGWFMARADHICETAIPYALLCVWGTIAVCAGIMSLRKPR